MDGFKIVVWREKLGEIWVWRARIEGDDDGEWGIGGNDPFPNSAVENLIENNTHFQFGM
jgi:hypothetical protein